jgi:hypothetical protein
MPKLKSLGTDLALAGMVTTISALPVPACDVSLRRYGQGLQGLSFPLSPDLCAFFVEVWGMPGMALLRVMPGFFCASKLASVSLNLSG